MVPCSCFSGPYTHAERIVRVENQFGLRANKCRTPDARIDLSFSNSHRALEHAPHNTFLLPNLAFFDLPVGVETSQFRTRASSAWGAIVGFARTQHKILAVDPGNLRRAE